MAETPPVPRSLRILNLLALAVFLAGAGFYGRAWFGMNELRAAQPAYGGELFSGMAVFNEYWELSRLGIWLMMAAGALALLAAVAALVMRRAGSHPPEGGGGGAAG